MNAFEKVIGYETIKNELLQICDMIHNREVYENLGARLPQGILLYGDPGLGKTLMVKCFIEESRLKAYTVRRNKGNDDFIGLITDTFKKAKDNAPSIVFLDDMDKFANEDDRHRDAEEYVAVQSGIDEIKGSDVFVVATANEARKLPQSLLRAGRFDRKINVQCPTAEDAVRIIEYYLSDKKVSKDINMEDLSKMISYSSCAELETILNEAAVSAASARKDSIGMDDLVRSVLRSQYDSPDNLTKTSAEDRKKTALHEAGHLVVCESILPESVGFASIRSSGRDSTGGFIHRCKDLARSYDHVLILLAGKAAVELYYADQFAEGCAQDIHRAIQTIKIDITNSAAFGFGLLDTKISYEDSLSENLNSRSEAVTLAELEKCMMKTRDILVKNREFLELAAKELEKKETLLFSDIQRIKSKVKVKKAA